MKQYLILIVSIVVFGADVFIANNWVRENKLKDNPKLIYIGTHTEFSNLKSLEGEILFNKAEALSDEVLEKNLDTPDFEKMLIYLTLAAENGFDGALIMLAMFYSADTEFRDLDRVNSLFQKAEKSGVDLAYHNGSIKEAFTPMQIWLRDRKGKSDDGS